ncbi:MAG: hypothetical protein PVF56_17990 [Desulfobacterales bacterium]|jgi:hypothetical protein
MKYYYLTDESEKSLAPFFSKMILSASFTCVVLISVVLLLVWPRRPISAFIVVNEVPLVYFLVFTAALIISAYLNLCCGCGDMTRRGYYIIKYRTDLTTYEKEIDFLQYGLIEFLWHTLILLLPFMPLLLLAASISAVSFTIFIAALSILYVVSLFCRMFGFVVYFFWGRMSTVGYIVARSFLVAYLFGTLFFVPFINPIHLLSLLSKDSYGIGLRFVFNMAVLTAIILLLIAASHIMVKRHIVKEETR